MAEFNRIKPERIEALSDMVFGLALSLSAIQLAFKVPNNQNEVAGYIAEFVFSFVLLIWMWLAYTRIMSRVGKEPSELLELNIGLLLTVSIEPYLLFVIFSGAIEGTDEHALYLSTIAWAVDIGAMILILGLMTYIGIVRSSGVLSGFDLRKYLHLSYWRIGLGLFFFATALPFFWSWSYTTSYWTENILSTVPHVVVHASYVAWFAGLLGGMIGSLTISWRKDPAASPDPA